MPMAVAQLLVVGQRPPLPTRKIELIMKKKYAYPTLS